jgi:eukaryotic-like serine/threonine-protein kinase
VATSSTPSSPPPIGLDRPTVLGGRYRLDRCLAYGGMAEVWTARDDVLGRRVAVKLLRPELADDALVRERFRREPLAAARLNHPNIVAIFDTVSEGGVEAVVMELVEGATLRERLDHEGTLDVQFVVHVGQAVAMALDTAHRAGIIHRDVKPGNILLGADGRVVLTDFGIATTTAGGDLTSNDVMMGTAKYLSPEHVQGRALDGRSDLYALAIVLYECLTGSVPFSGETDASTALARVTRDATPPSSLRPSLPPALNDLLVRTLARDPAERPSSAAVFRDELVRSVVLPRPAAPDGPATQPIARVGSEPSRVDLTVVTNRERTTSVPRPSPRTVTFEPVSPPRKTAVAAIHERRRHALVPIGVLLAAAAIAAGALIDVVKPWNVGGASSAISSGTTTAGNVGSGITDVAEFDPSPGDGAEHPKQTDYVRDGDLGTAWTTACYGVDTMYPKHGVGLVVSLQHDIAGHALVLDSPNSGWKAEVYVADQKGDDLAAWGTPVTTVNGDQAGANRIDLANAHGNQVLLWFTKLGKATGGCTKYPYQESVSELHVAP